MKTTDVDASTAFHSALFGAHGISADLFDHMHELVDYIPFLYGYVMNILG